MPDSLGGEIKRLADARGLATHQAIADATGLSRSFVTRLLAGHRPQLTALVLYQLCEGLGVDCDHFRPFIVAASPPTPPERPKGKLK